MQVEKFVIKVGSDSSDSLDSESDCNQLNSGSEVDDPMGTEYLDSDFDYGE